jgi:hypothetical protein
MCSKLYELVEPRAPGASGTQNPLERKLRAGSTPAPGTTIF